MPVVMVKYQPKEIGYFFEEEEPDDRNNLFGGHSENV
jgi:rubredoxin